MYLINLFRLFKIKFLLIVSIFNLKYLNLLLIGFVKKLILIGFLKNYILIIYVLGSLELSFYLKNFLNFKIFNFVYLFGLIFKNKSFHFELICLNIIFFINLISLNFSKLLINNLFFFKKKINYLNKIYNINNNNWRSLTKYLNILLNLNYTNLINNNF